MDLNIKIKKEPLLELENDKGESPSLASEVEEEDIKPETKEEVEKSTSSLACKICNATFIRSKMLENHEEQRKCQQAKKNQKKDIKPKIKEEVEKSTSSSACKLCNATFIRSKMLENHEEQRKCQQAKKVQKKDIKPKIKEEVEKSTSSSACKLCNATFIRSKMLENHEKQRKCQQAKKIQKKVPFQIRCAWCWIPFKSHTTLKEHIVSDHDSVYPFTCKHCGKGYTVKCYLLYHINKNHKGNKIQDKSRIKKARKVVVKSLSHPCQQCDRIYDAPQNLRRHVVVDHLKRKKYCCDICGQSFFAKIQFTYHSNKMHQTEDIECEYCHRKFYLRSNLTKHVDAVHLKTITFICSQCDKSYPQKCQLKAHISKVHEPHKFFCELCGKSFFLLNRLKKHIEASCSRRVGQTSPDKFCQENCEEIKDPVPHIHCTKCKRTFARESSMLVHYRVAHENAMLINCHKCENTPFENRAQYLLHCNLVHNDEEHHCKMCPLKFPDLLSLKKHKLGDHRAEIKCTICDGTFFTSLQLEYHINKVHGKNVYQCENCTKKFFLQALCKRHNETVHLKIKPFQCEECSETFASKIQRLTHAVKVHNFSKFQCKTCDRNFPGNNILRKHVVKKHADAKL